MSRIDDQLAQEHLTAEETALIEAAFKAQRIAMAMDGDDPTVYVQEWGDQPTEVFGHVLNGVLGEKIPLRRWLRQQQGKRWPWQR